MFSYIYFSKLRYVLHKKLLFFKKCLHTCTSALKLFYTKSLHLLSILHKRVILINTFLIDEPFYLTLSRVLKYKLFYNKYIKYCLYKIYYMRTSHQKSPLLIIFYNPWSQVPHNKPMKSVHTDTLYKNDISKVSTVDNFLFLPKF